MRVKSKIYVNFKYYADMQCLLFNGKLLEDNLKICDYSIHAYNTINLIFNI